VTLNIRTYNQLASLIDYDLKISRIKDLAELFLSGMRDWPTYNQTEILDYVKELKDYFGNPLTIEAIRTKRINNLEFDCWHHESGNSISDMLEISKLGNDAVDSDVVLNKIISYYETEFANTDFVADLKYRTTEEGGRKLPAFSKYRSQVKFEFDEMQTSGVQTFIDQDKVLPGESIRAKIRLSEVDYFAGKLEDDMHFEFREGPRIIGNGKIRLILNEKLKKPLDKIV